jgi:DNA (cytosine-5)-methyltransferase 1
LDGHGAYIPVAFSQNQREEVREVEVPGALSAEPGTHQQTYIAQPVPYDLFQITAPVNRQNRKPGDPCHTLARDNAAHAAVAFQLAGDRSDPTVSVSDAAFCLPANSMSDRGQAVAIGTDCYNGAITGDVAATMGTPGSSVNASGPTVMHSMTVRRLSARECERLQGFPDDWTLIPWRKKPASECPDGPRYKALGNSMACNCMAWIGERIAKWEARHD